MRSKIRPLLRDIILFFRKHLSSQNEEFPYYLLIFICFLFFVFGINIFVELTDQLSGKNIASFDNNITGYITSFRNPQRNEVIEFITHLGDIYGYLVMTTLVVFYLYRKLKNWKFILQLLGVVILSALSNIALKKAINRARPSADHLVVVESLSYPSGHAMSAMAFYGFLIYLLFHIKMSRLLRSVLFFIFAILILAIGVSRIYLGVHYPSDVFAGFIAGLIWVAFCIILFNIIDLLRRRKRNNYELEENLET